MAGIRGEGGEIRWAYHLAGALETFTITQRPGPPPRATVVGGRLGHRDAFKLAQRPLVFVWPRGAHRWTWPIDTMEIRDDHLIARLGPRRLD